MIFMKFACGILWILQEQISYKSWSGVLGSSWNLLTVFYGFCEKIQKTHKVGFYEFHDSRSFMNFVKANFMKLTKWDFMNFMKFAYGLLCILREWISYKLIKWNFMNFMKIAYGLLWSLREQVSYNS